MKNTRRFFSIIVSMFIIFSILPNKVYADELKPLNKIWYEVDYNFDGNIDFTSEMIDINSNEFTFTSDYSFLFPLTENGQYTFFISDSAGNVQAKVHTENYIDREKPSFEAVFDDEWTYDKDITIKASDNISLNDYVVNYNGTNVKGGYFDYINLYWNGTEITRKPSKYSEDFSFKVFENGTCTIKLTDFSGNEYENSFEVNTIDFTAPNIDYDLVKHQRSDDKPVSEEWYELSVKATDTESGIVGYKITKDGDTFSEYSDDKSYTFTLNGDYEIFVKDKVGNVSSKSFQISDLSEKFKVIYEDVYNDNVLGTETKYIKKGTKVTGSDIGKSTERDIYYKGYTYKECSENTVKENVETTVRREFNLSKYRVKYFSENGELFGTEELSFQSPYTFDKSPIKATEKTSDYIISYVFKGWSQNKSSLIEKNYEFREDVELFPIYQENRVIVEKIKTEGDTPINSQINPVTEDEYVLLGETSKSEKTEETKERPIYLVTFYIDDVVYKSKEVYEGDSLSMIAKKSIVDTDTERISYEFIGWVDGNGEKASLVNITADMDLYARFREIRYKLSTIEKAENIKEIFIPKGISQNENENINLSQQQSKKELTNISNSTIQVIENDRHKQAVALISFGTFLGALTVGSCVAIKKVGGI